MNTAVTEAPERIAQILSPILIRSTQSRLGFYCPGCKAMHMLKMRSESGSRPSWLWNGNVNFPTFLPSYHEKIGHYVKGQPQPPNCVECNEDGPDTACGVCHSIIRNGVIQFLTDCTHKLAGQTVSLIPIPQDVLRDMAS